jgi:hypothetical protein
VSHFPLERDPDSESAPGVPGAGMPRVPGPPRLPQQAEGRTKPTTATLGVAAAPPPRVTPRPTPQQDAHRKALIALVDRVTDAVGLSSFDLAPVADEALAERIDAAAREQAKAMRADGEAPEGVDIEALARDALRELTDLGPLGPLLEEDQADEVYVPRPDCVLAVRGGQLSVVEPSFTSEEALSRVVSPRRWWLPSPSWSLPESALRSWRTPTTSTSRTRS